MKHVLVKITTPDEVEPLDVLNCMVDDFFYSNRNTEDFGPHMENISTAVVKREEDLLKEIVRIINMPGEEGTDGECLDYIIELLQAHGVEVIK
jgi:hypothetical protein